MKNLRKTLALLLAIVLLAGALPLTALAASFTDVPNDMYYAEPVRWSVEKGIVYGTSSSTFSPNAKCTIEQIITFLDLHLPHPQGCKVGGLSGPRGCRCEGGRLLLQGGPVGEGEANHPLGQALYRLHLYPSVCGTIHLAGLWLPAA